MTTRALAMTTFRPWRRSRVPRTRPRRWRRWTEFWALQWSTVNTLQVNEYASYVKVPSQYLEAISYSIAPLSRSFDRHSFGAPWCFEARESCPPHGARY